MAVIFDLDETLMPEHPAALAAIEATAGDGHCRRERRRDQVYPDSTAR